MMTFNFRYQLTWAYFLRILTLKFSFLEGFKVFRYTKNYKLYSHKQSEKNIFLFKILQNLEREGRGSSGTCCIIIICLSELGEATNVVTIVRHCFVMLKLTYRYVDIDLPFFKVSKSVDIWLAYFIY